MNSESGSAERIWQDVASTVQADLHVDAMAEAFEVYRAEIARTRLVDRSGPVQVMLLGGGYLHGHVLREPAVEECLGLISPEGVVCLVPTGAVLSLRGGTPELRPEPAAEPSRLSVWLRHQEGRHMRLHLRDGSVWSADLMSVASDHVTLEVRGERGPVAVPFTAVEAWCVP